jgi:hypothetical protein
MVMSSDLRHIKILFPSNHNMHGVLPPFLLKKTQTKVEEQKPKECIEPSSWDLISPKNVNTCIWLARIACFLDFLPFLILILPSEQNGVRISVCIYLCIMPLTSFVLLLFTCKVCDSGRNIFIRFSCIIIAAICLIMGNIASVFFLQHEKGYLALAFLFLSLSMSLGSIQLLLLLNKSNVLRVMICTASSVLIVILNILAFQYSTVNSMQAKRFYQSSSLPFILLFFETTRSHS